jgi:hypothetical protein
MIQCWHWHQPSWLRFVIFLSPLRQILGKLFRLLLSRFPSRPLKSIHYHAVNKTSSGKTYSRTSIWYDTDRIENDTSQQFFVAVGTCLQSLCLATIREYTDRPTGCPLIQRRPLRICCVLFSVIACVFFAAVTFLPRSCLTTYSYRQPDGSHLWSTPFRWVQVSWYTYRDS